MSAVLWKCLVTYGWWLKYDYLNIKKNHCYWNVWKSGGKRWKQFSFWFRCVVCPLKTFTHNFTKRLINEAHCEHDYVTYKGMRLWMTETLLSFLAHLLQSQHPAVRTGVNIANLISSTHGSLALCVCAAFLSLTQARVQMGLRPREQRGPQWSCSDRGSKGENVRKENRKRWRKRGERGRRERAMCTNAQTDRIMSMPASFRCAG